MSRNKKSKTASASNRPASRNADAARAPAGESRVSAPHSAAAPVPTALWAARALLIAATCIAYSTSFAGDFVFDDYRHILADERIRDLSDLATVLGDTRRPVVALTLAVNYAVGEDNPAGYHAVNLAIHVAAVLVLFGLLRRLVALPHLAEGLPAGWHVPLALAAALLWAVHPLQTQSVTYIIQRGESLMGLFYLLTLYAVVRGAPDGNARRGWYAFAVLCCALGMGTKAIMVTAPAAVLLLDWTLLGRNLKSIAQRRWPLYLGLAATWGVLALLGVLEGILDPTPDAARAAGFGFKGVTPLEYLRTQPLVILHYLRLVLIPYPLVLDYNWLVATNLAAISAGAAAILALLGVSIYGLARRRWWGFAGTLFFLVLAPTSSFVPIKDLAFEHRMYLPLAAVLSVIVFGLARLLQRRAAADAQRLTRARNALLGGIGIVAVVLTGMTAARNLDYRSPVIMWQDVVEKRPRNSRAWSSLATARAMAGDKQAAVEAFARAVELNPDDPGTLVNYGKALLELGRAAEAAERLALGIERSTAPDAALFNTLASARRQAGDRAGAAEAFREAIERDPANSTYHFNLGVLLAEQGRFADAAAQFEAATQANPDDMPARLARAEALQRAGAPAAAERVYQAAIAHAPSDYQANFTYGTYLLRAERPAEALTPLSRAIAVNPAAADALTNRGNAHLLLNDPAAALADFEAALRIRPDHLIARVQRGRAHEMNGDRAAALEDYRAVLARDPANRPARAGLQRLSGG